MRLRLRAAGSSPDNDPEDQIAFGPSVALRRAVVKRFLLGDLRGARLISSRMVADHNPKIAVFSSASSVGLVVE